MFNKLDSLYLNASSKLKSVAKDVLTKENGDTNFISIIIILGIVIALAVIFKGYIGKITTQVNASVNGFTVGL